MNKQHLSIIGGICVSRLLELVCALAAFLLSFEREWKANQLPTDKQRELACQLSPSEVMTILIHFHQSHYRPFKAYSLAYVRAHLTSEFPHLVSYTRFVALIPRMMLPLLAYLQSRFGTCTGISFIASTSLARLRSQTDQWAPRLCG